MRGPDLSYLDGLTYAGLKFEDELTNLSWAEIRKWVSHRILIGWGSQDQIFQGMFDKGDCKKLLASEGLFWEFIFKVK
jgi:hypothetical protein